MLSDIGLVEILYNLYNTQQSKSDGELVTIKKLCESIPEWSDGAADVIYFSQ